MVTQDELFTGARLHEPLILNGKDISNEEAERLYNLMDGIYDKLTDLSDTITVLTRGRVLAEGDYKTVSTNPEVREAYMGTGHA